MVGDEIPVSLRAAIAAFLAKSDIYGPVLIPYSTYSIVPAVTLFVTTLA